MSDSPTTQSITSGGIAAEHILLPEPRALVAATNSKTEHNAIRPALIPFACWRADDMRFDFESSFVRPEIELEMASLRDLIERHTLADAKGGEPHKPALTVFGHADPTGGDDFNKALSGRRAQAIYAMLVRKVDLWEDLYSNPFGNDKWEPKAIHTMQSTLGQPLSDHPSSAARKALFKAYMDHVCTVLDEKGNPASDSAGQPVRLELKLTDFLANGTDTKGKGDFQGCGEFNPIMIFSEAENKGFSDPKTKAARDAENAPNRRVLIFLFRPGIRINPSNWPCPRAKEGVEGCKKRFWSDGEKRRSNRLPDDRREYKDSPDTFACRFYDRLSNNSPCERFTAGLCHFTYVLHSDSDETPVANSDFKIEAGPNDVRQGRTDASGNLEAGEVEPGDFKLVIAGTTMTIPALNKKEARRRLRVRLDLPQA